MKKLIYLILLLGYFSNAQSVVIDRFTRFAADRGTIYFTDNAATPTPYEVNGTAGVADESTNYTMTSDADSDNGTYAIQAQLNNDITATQGLTMTLNNLKENTSYDVSCRCKVSAGAGNARMQLRSSEGWGSNQSSGFFTESYTTITLTETTGSGITSSSVRFIFTSSGDNLDSIFFDNCTVTEN